MRHRVAKLARGRNQDVQRTTRQGHAVFHRQQERCASTMFLNQSRSDDASPTIVRSSLCPTGRTIDFCRGWAWQQLLLSRRLAHRRTQRTRQLDGSDQHDDANALLLLEHAPVYTLGRGSDEKHLTFLKDRAYHSDVLERLSRSSRGTTSARLSVDRRLLDDDTIRPQSCHDIVKDLSSIAFPVIAPNGVPIYRVERGGEVTFHGPGQLVVYPMLDLQRPPFREDLRWYLRMIEQVIIETLQEYDIDGVRDEINTGVWVDHCKVAAVGVSASRWITTHGFALNISADLDYFDASMITPCGIDGRGVTSIAEILRKRGQVVPSLVEVSGVVLNKVQDVFKIELQNGEALS